MLLDKDGQRMWKEYEMREREKYSWRKAVTRGSDALASVSIMRTRRYTLNFQKVIWVSGRSGGEDRQRGAVEWTNCRIDANPILSLMVFMSYLMVCPRSRNNRDTTRRAVLLLRSVMYIVPLSYGFCVRSSIKFSASAIYKYKKKRDIKEGERARNTQQT